MPNVFGFCFHDQHFYPRQHEILLVQGTELLLSKAFPPAASVEDVLFGQKMLSDLHEI